VWSVIVVNGFYSKGASLNSPLFNLSGREFQMTSRRSHLLVTVNPWTSTSQFPVWGNLYKKSVNISELLSELTLNALGSVEKELD